MDLQRIMSMAANVQAQALAAAQAAQARADFFSKTLYMGGRWDVNVEGGVAVAGQVLRGHPRFEPDSPAQARRLRIRLVGNEMAAYDRQTTRRDADSSGSHDTNDEKLIRPTDLGQFVTAIDLAQAPAPGVPLESDFGLPVEGWALPTVDMVDSSGRAVYEIGWAFECALVVDVNDPSPSAFFRAPLVVAQVPDASTAGLPPAALEAETQSDGSPTCRIALAPVPLVSGAPFSGHAALSGFDPPKMRAVIEAVVETKAPDDVHGDGVAITFGGLRSGAVDVSVSGVSATIELWRGPITGAAGALSFEGVAPVVAAVQGPNGSVAVRLSVVEDRRFMPDRNWRRPVAVATGPRS